MLAAPAPARARVRPGPKRSLIKLKTLTLLQCTWSRPGSNSGGRGTEDEGRGLFSDIIYCTSHSRFRNRGPDCFRRPMGAGSSTEGGGRTSCGPSVKPPPMKGLQLWNVWSSRHQSAAAQIFSVEEGAFFVAFNVSCCLLFLLTFPRDPCVQQPKKPSTPCTNIFVARNRTGRCLARKTEWCTRCR